MSGQRHGAGTRSATTVTVLPAGIVVLIDPDVCLLDGLRAAGWRSPYKCRRGGCGACKARLVQGAVYYRSAPAESVLSADDVSRGLCLPCRAHADTDVVLELEDPPLHSIVASLGRTTPASAATEPAVVEQKES